MNSAVYGRSISDRKSQCHLYLRQSSLTPPRNGSIRARPRLTLLVEEGSLYPALHRMEEARWVRAEWTTKDNGRRARMYEITAAGRKRLAAEASRWQEVTAAVNRVLRTV